jgi:hypothetical protein
MSRAEAVCVGQQSSGWSKAISLLELRRFQLITLLLWAFFMNREGVRVPNGNEYVYLLYFYKAWHPNFLANDWTFQETTAGHAVFNLALGWLTVIFSLETAAWIGRFSVWTALFIGLLRLGSHYRIPSWGVWAGIVLWLVQRQAPVVMEWMIGTFEAKCVAYICLVFAIDAALRSRNLLAGLLCGIAFSFHTAVGLWGGVALGAAVIFHNRPQEALRFCIAALLFGLPGLVSSLPLVFGPHAINAQESQFIVQVFAPACLDPLNVPRIWFALLPALVLFSYCFTRWTSNSRSMRMLFCFELFLSLFFLFGLLARIENRFDLVQLYPLRVFSVFVLLLFYWQVAEIIFCLVKPLESASRLRRPVLFITFGSILLLAIPSPLLELKDVLQRHANRIAEISGTKISPARNEDVSFREAALWIQQNTPIDDVVIAPPWRSDAFYFTNRPLIASWHAPRYDAITEWKHRIEDLAGDVTTENDSPDNMGTEQRLYYLHLSVKQIRSLSDRYHARWLISSASYPFSPVYQTADFNVYKLR